MHDQDLTEAIRQRAYEIWLSEGRPHGRDRIHWLRAEAECREMFNAEHSGSGCKAGLHEKPIEPRIKKRRTRKADRTPKQSKPSG